MSEKSTAVPTITLETVLDSFQHWRDNKSSYPSGSIPDEIWEQVFALESEGRHKGPALRKMFGLNSSQYKRKRTELCSSMGSEQPIEEGAVLKQPTKDREEAIVPTAFSEAVVAPLTPAVNASINGTTKADLSKLKSTRDDGLSFLAQSTIIVECIRPDGHRLKIHTTNSSLDTVMQSFLNQEVVSS